GFGRAVLAVLVVVALAAIYGLANIGHLTAAAQRRGPVGRVDVSSAVRVCTAPGSAAPTASSLAMTAIAAPAASGAAVVTPLVPAGSKSAPRVAATLHRPGLLQTATVPIAPPLTPAEQAGQPGSSSSVRTQPGRGGVLVQASGALAQGLAVEQVGGNGLVTAQCGVPGTDFWFVGAGRMSGGGIDLYLSNAGSQPADAQVQVLVDGGSGPPALGNADNGITVPPHGMVVQSLNGLLQGSGLMAIHVSATVGQVFAEVRESKLAGQQGIWLPSVQAPARHLVIPGLPGTPGSRHLYIAVPNVGVAQVKITAVTKRGSYQPTGGTGIELVGGSVSDIPLPSLGGVAGAVSITSSVPVAAAMLVPGGPVGTPGALAVSASPVQEQAVFAANPAGPAGQTQLVLSAPGKAASVRITTATSTRPATGHDGQVVKVAAKSSVVVPVRPPAGSGVSKFSFVVTPLAGSGPVYGGRIISAQGLVQSVLPAPSSLTWIPLPDVRESVGGILGSGKQSG
ncbi:MAG: hypothetical protein J2P27_05075, partial [Actinobacteria bacterium]|nr:hypothetical protein [Actinomycetota bacterium]